MPAFHLRRGQHPVVARALEAQSSGDTGHARSPTPPIAALSKLCRKPPQALPSTRLVSAPWLRHDAC